VRIVDTNLLLYAVDSTSPHHRRARAWLEDILSDGDPVGFPSIVLTAFVRISTLRAFSLSPLTPGAAAAHVDSWLSAPGASVTDPGPEYWRIFRELLVTVDARGNLVTDAHIAAIASERSGTVYSADMDFGRFPGLRWVNPLLQPP
jgi:hypothetical protein